MEKSHSHPHDYVALYMGYKKTTCYDQAWDGAIPGEVRPVLCMHSFLYFVNKNMSTWLVFSPSRINTQVFHVNNLIYRTKCIIIE